MVMRWWPRFSGECMCCIGPGTGPSVQFERTFGASTGRSWDMIVCLVINGGNTRFRATLVGPKILETTYALAINRSVEVLELKVAFGETDAPVDPR